MFHKIIVTGLAALALVQCSPKPAAPPAPASAKPVDFAPNFAYDIALHIKPEATAKAKTLVIAAKYYGLPRPETANQATAAGVIEFNTDTVEISATDQTIHMTGAGMPKDRLKDITGGAPLVQITVKDKAGRIGCSVFQDYVKTAQAKPVGIWCGLN
ncbi:hypothetical protein [Asticcacaulis sp.]|uniref:hypothetical protein n=1 Tax=Asticcacaulis sp. TaxID=1872648 RepID=UPI002B6FDF75|nr:hypothetical protein [Asticcacaulis sp.]HTM80928.1 hypothetical protein [Asticcacaulis sp.]